MKTITIHVDEEIFQNIKQRADEDARMTGWDIKPEDVVTKIVVAIFRSDKNE